jgi:hypothetical protein
MNTAFLLMAQYNGAAIIPVETVCRDYFTHLTADKFVRKVAAGEIAIPLVRMEGKSQKAAKGVHLADLAAWIDARRVAAVKECQQLQHQATASSRICRQSGGDVRNVSACSTDGAQTHKQPAECSASSRTAG